MNIEQLRAYFLKYWKLALFVLLIIVIAIMSFEIKHLKTKLTDNEQTITTMTEEQATNVNALQNELKVNKQNAETLAAYIEKIQAGTIKPDASFKVTASTPEQAVKEVVSQITAKDPTLPAAVYEKTDKTVVATQTSNTASDTSTEYPVGVYKINTYRNWEIGTGIGEHNGDFYVPVSIQRNYSKNHSIEAEIHLDKDIVKGHVSGGELKWNIGF
ncbi:hypothetical protein [Pectinatus frisingensis]|uniref:hypothetical protein n=1 Tax=Pectinatus frisingensis TaxID=865 RepID=UPI0018C7109A|nr:hypothetical protein [Pectinatus frisingensis]